MNKPGFSLIELMIAVGIASVLGVLLFAALDQIRKLVPVVDTITQVYESAALVNMQLERDLSGVTAPTEFYARQKKEAPPAQPIQKKKEEESKKNQQAKNAAEVKPPEPPPKPFEKLFYGTAKGDNFEQLTFITTNPLQVYWSAKAGAAKPRMARILYTLKEEKNTVPGLPKSYSLVRQESKNLNYEALNKEETKAQEQILAQGIKSAAIEYTAVLVDETEKKEKEQDAQKAAQEKKVKEIRKSFEWLDKTTPEKPEQPVAEQKKEKKLPLVPGQVELTISFWDIQKKRAFPFSFKIPIRSVITEKQSSRLLDKLKDLVSHVFPTKPKVVVAQAPKRP